MLKGRAGGANNEGVFDQTRPIMPEETVRVLVRCRPFNKREEDLNCENVIEMDQEVRPHARNNTHTHTHNQNVVHFQQR